jgi:hypothetical protein
VRFLKRHIWGFESSPKEAVLAGIVSAIVLAIQYCRGSLTGPIWRHHFCKAAYPVITVLAGFAIWHTGKAAYLVVKDVEANPKIKIVDPCLRLKVWGFAVLLSVVYALVPFIAWQRSKPAPQRLFMQVVQPPSQHSLPLFPPA